MQSSPTSVSLISLTLCCLGNCRLNLGGASGKPCFEGVVGILSAVPESFVARQPSLESSLEAIHLAWALCKSREFFKLPVVLSLFAWHYKVSTSQIPL